MKRGQNRAALLVLLLAILLGAPFIRTEQQPALQNPERSPESLLQEEPSRTFVREGAVRGLSGAASFIRAPPSASVSQEPADRRRHPESLRSAGSTSPASATTSSQSSDDLPGPVTAESSARRSLQRSPHGVLPTLNLSSVGLQSDPASPKPAYFSLNAPAKKATTMFSMSNALQSIAMDPEDYDRWLSKGLPVMTRKKSTSFPRRLRQVSPRDASSPSADSPTPAAAKTSPQADLRRDNWWGPRGDAEVAARMQTTHSGLVARDETPRTQRVRQAQSFNSESEELTEAFKKRAQNPPPSSS